MPEPVRRTTFHPTGQLQWEWFVLRDEQQHGPSRAWNPDGLLIEEGAFDRNRRHGIWRKWHDNGRLAFEAHYFHGLEDGTTRSWDASGNLLDSYIMVRGTGTARIRDGWMGTTSEISYRDGVMHGPMTIFSSSGKKIASQYHYRGRQISRKKFEETTAAEAAGHAVIDPHDDVAETNASAPKYFRKRPPSAAQLKKAKQSDNALLNMLAAPNASEARDWLAPNFANPDGGSARHLGDFPTPTEALAEIERFYAAGALQVTLVDTQTVFHDAHASQAIIGLPEDAEPRSRLFARAAKWAKQQGFEPEKDQGQKLLFVTFN